MWQPQRKLRSSTIASLGSPNNNNKSSVPDASSPTPKKNNNNNKNSNPVAAQPIADIVEHTSHSITLRFANSSSSRGAAASPGAVTELLRGMQLEWHRPEPGKCLCVRLSVDLNLGNYWEKLGGNNIQAAINNVQPLSEGSMSLSGGGGGGVGIEEVLSNNGEDHRERAWISGNGEINRRVHMSELAVFVGVADPSNNNNNNNN
eukprot:PhM_4_TR10010/c8_g1_i2/m.34924